MDDARPSTSPSAWGKFISKLLGSLTPQWIALILDLVQNLRQTIAQRQPKGMYEMVAYDARLELLDGRGELATFSKRQRVRFLQDNIISFQDHAWGEGDIFTDYDCSPGVVADRYQAGDRWNILMV